MKIKLTRDVKVDGRDMPSGSMLTEADCSVGTMQSLVGSEWAYEVKGSSKKATTESPDLTNQNDLAGQGDSNSGDDLTVESLAHPSHGFSKTAVASLRKEGVETIAQAKAYAAEHGSFEPIKGVSQQAAEKLAELIAA